MLIKSYFNADVNGLSDEEFWQMFAEAQWLEEREIYRMAAAITKAFGAK